MGIAELSIESWIRLLENEKRKNCELLQLLYSTAADDETKAMIMGMGSARCDDWLIPSDISDGG